MSTPYPPISWHYFGLFLELTQNDVNNFLYLLSLSLILQVPFHESPFSKNLFFVFLELVKNSVKVPVDAKKGKHLRKKMKILRQYSVFETTNQEQKKLEKKKLWKLISFNLLIIVKRSRCFQRVTFLKPLKKNA